MTLPQFQKTILLWHRKNIRDPHARAPKENKYPTGQASTVRGRLPWRKTRDPYKILVSEVMLQQTQISRVLPKYEEFLKAFPTLEALAKAQDKKLLKVWQGLGYWRRAKYLKATSKLIVKEAKTADLTRRVGAHVEPEAKCGVKREEKPQFERNFPKIPERLEELPGIGPYTAGAVACFAFGSREAFLDTNIRRVYLHFFFPRRKNVSDKEILKIAQKAVDTLPKGVSPREWHYALFDYGATVLKNREINRRSRHYHKQSKFDGSFRSFRTKVVKALLASPSGRLPQTNVHTLLKKELARFPFTPQEILSSLLKDDLIKKSSTHYSL